MKRTLFRRLPRRLGDERGNALIEAAIMTPLLLLLTFGIVEFGSMFWVYLALENGVSVGTRYAVTGNTMDDPAKPGSKLSRVDSIKTAIRDATPSITLTDSAFTFDHMSPGSATWVNGIGAPSDIERVTVAYTWTFFTPLFKPFFTNGEINIKVDSSMKNEGRFE